MTEPLLRVSNLEKKFPIQRGMFKRTVGQIHAVDGISFEIAAGETLGLVGESGCGKSTTARLILRLLDPTSGEIFFDGKEIHAMTREEIRAVRKDMQIVFQDPYASLNPRRQIGAIIEEPMRIHGMGKDERRARTHELLEKVGLDKNSYEKYPHEFSGGQRQRVVIARALTLKPELIIADEPVSALDVSIQAQVLNLFKELQDEMKLTYIFVAHDLGVVRHISDRIAVMYLGKIVELGSVEEIYNNPQHPYTKALLSANPRIDQSAQSTRQILTGDIPSPLNRPSGCSFHTRCPIAVPECITREPELRRLGAVDVACNLVV